MVVSNSPFGDQDIYEYTPAGAQVQAINVTPAADGRDLVIDRDGRVQIYNGPFDSTLKAYRPRRQHVSSRSFADWSTVNNLTYGGVAAFGR